MSLLETLLYYAHFFIHPALLVVSLIIGIIILGLKEKVTKFLGMWITCEAVFGILEAVFTQVMRYGGAEKATHSAIYFRVAEIAFLAAAALALFSLIKKKKSGGCSCGCGNCPQSGTCRKNPSSRDERNTEC